MCLNSISQTSPTDLVFFFFFSKHRPVFLCLVKAFNNGTCESQYQRGRTLIIRHPTILFSDLQVDSVKDVLCIMID